MPFFYLFSFKWILFNLITKIFHILISFQENFISILFLMHFYNNSISSSLHYQLVCYLTVYLPSLVI